MAYQLSQYAAILDRQLASSSPAPGISRVQDDRPRPMHLRILYTIDVRADHQYLAKLQHALPTRTVVLPDGSQLGTIDLKTCLQAVLKASPELYSDGMEYTVYAFDPSEQGTPRVGYGRLKEIVLANDSTEQDQVMVTGLVRNNMTYLATSPQVQDNLEIRLTLTPVQARGQTDSGSRSPFLQERPASPRIPGYTEVENPLRLDKLNPQLLLLLQQAANSQVMTSSQDALQRFMSQGGNDYRTGRPSTSGNFTSFTPPLQHSRPTSPALSINSDASGRSRQNLKRTASNVSKSNIPDLPSTLSQVDAGYVSGEEICAPKRARVMPVGRPGKTVLSKKSDLRVAASTAASVRVYQPAAIRPSFLSNQSIEELPRIPTPVPQGNSFTQRRPSAARSSLGLRAEASFSRDSGSPHSELNHPSLPSSTATSPDAISNTAGSPVEMGSSPPIIPGIDGCPSSPALPPLPLHDDSGFMSGGGFNDMSEIENEDQVMPSPNAGPMNPPAKRKRFNNIVFKEPQVLRNSPPNIQAPTALSASRARNAAGLKKAVTPLSSEALKALEASKRPRGRPNKITEDKRPIWDKEKRRQAMVAKLHSSVANGEIPPYCHNCGVIETPTWRRAFTKIHSGEPPCLMIPKGGVKEDGAIIGFEIVQQNPETGKNELFRIYKKNLLPSDEGFGAISLCNPCGLWLKNRGINRPEKLWVKGNDAEESRSQDIPERERRPRLARGDEEPQSDVTGMTSLPSHSGKRPAISHHQSSIMSEPPAPSNIESNASQPAAAPVVYSGQELRTDIQAYPVDTSALQANSNNETTPNNFKNPIELEKGDASSFRRSLFSSPKSSGPLGTDIASSIILPENDSVLVDLDEPGFTCLDKDIRINVSNSLEAETIADGQATERPSTPARKSLPPPPVTPVHDTIGKDASFSRSPSNLFKTPSNASAGTPSNQRVTSSDFFSFSAKKLLHGASANMTPSRGGGRTPQTDNDRFSPQIPRLLRTIYGSNSPENEDFSDMFDVNMEHLFNDCCPGFPIHREECPKRAIMMSQPEFDEADFRTGFPGTDEDWAAADAFFNSSGVTGFTPRKRVSANSMQQEEEPVLKD